MRRAKFTMAFENSASKDYVTEKFFQPILDGSVPVTYGAPNIADYAPGPHSIINAFDYTYVARICSSAAKVLCRVNAKVATGRQSWAKCCSRHRAIKRHIWSTMRGVSAALVTSSRCSTQQSQAR